METVRAGREDGREIGRSQSVTVFVAFAALAVLDGPVRSYAGAAFYPVVRYQVLAGGALSAALAGVVLLGLSVARRPAMLRGKQWLALLVLLAPQWLALPLTAPYVRAVPWLHETPWGAAFLLTLAAPLWLGLLAALGWVKVEVPRAVVGAAIVGIGAVYLVIPVDATRVAPDQVPVLALQLLLSIALVASWVYVASRLAGAGTVAVAGWFLLLSAVGDASFAVLFERRSWQPANVREIMLPLLVQAAVTAASCWLWFWLLQRMTLAALAMRALAAWTATVLPGFVLFGFMSWRIDAALALSAGAIVVALRARVAEEQPLALGLHGR